MVWRWCLHMLGENFNHKMRKGRQIWWTDTHQLHKWVALIGDSLCDVFTNNRRTQTHLPPNIHLYIRFTHERSLAKLEKMVRNPDEDFKPWRRNRRMQAIYLHNLVLSYPNSEKLHFEAAVLQVHCLTIASKCAFTHHVTRRPLPSDSDSIDFIWPMELHKRSSMLLMGF